MLERRDGPSGNLHRRWNLFFGWNGKLEKFTYLYKKIYIIYVYLFCGLMVSDCFGVVSKKGNLNSFVYDNLELN